MWLKDRAFQFISSLSIFTIGSLAFAANPEAVPGEYVVKLKNQVNLYSVQKQLLSQSLNSYVKRTIPGQNVVVIKRPVFETEKSVIKSLSQNNLVQIVEPNYIYRINKTPNDPLLGKLWGMNNIGQPDNVGQVGVAGVDIGVEKAWDIQTGSKDVIIAVVDTGINYNHPDLVDNVWTNDAELNGKPGVDDDNNGYIDDIHGWNAVTHTGDPLDDHGHGSHCSGTIGARGDDNKGIVGVNWNVRIMGVKFLAKDGSGSLESAIEAIDYATKNGAKILSNSWGGGGFSQTLKEAIDRTNAAGALFVAAAGNESNDNDRNPSYPASYDVPNVLTVAAVDNKGVMASFSNYGRTKVHVGAPGVEIYSSIAPAGYDSWSGTSMATPHVSGIAGLLAANEPNLSGVEMKERIIATSRPLAGLKGKIKTGGIANAYNALTNTQAPPDPNDPSNWATTSLAVASAHPYAAKIKEEYVVEVPGAKEFAIYFSKFTTERTYDTVQIYDENGKLVQTLSGTNDDSFSAVIPGSKAKIKFTADDSVQYFGFEITKAAFR